MDEYTNKLLKQVTANNPGAWTVVTRLQWYTKWFEILKHLVEIDLVGGRLWARYKDDYHQDLSAFGDALIEEIREKEAKRMKRSDKRTNRATECSF